MATQTQTNPEILLYDADCPMCKWYTRKFVDLNVLDETGRVPYSQMGPFVKQKIDMKRARNEIALYNKATGETLYGVQSLVSLLSKKWKWMERTFKYKIFAVAVEKIYSFISYNRKIIVPTAQNEHFLSCFPEPKPVYRIAFLAFCMVIVNAIVGNYFETQLSQYGRNYFPFREMLFFVGQLLFQGIVFGIFKLKNFYDYAGHVSFISFKGSILLGIFTLFNLILFNLGFNVLLFQPFFFGAVFMYMFLEHKRVVALVGFPKWLSYTWLCYRALIYPLAFNLF